MAARPGTRHAIVAALAHTRCTSTFRDGIGGLAFRRALFEEIGLAQNYLDQLKNDGAEALIDMWENSEDRALP